MMGATGGVTGELEWAEVVALARDAIVHGTGGAGKSVAQAIPPPATPTAVPFVAPARAPVPAPTAPPAAATTVAANPAQGAASGGKKKCGYCAPLGLGMDTHD